MANTDEKEKKETVEVDKSTLAEILSRLDNFEKKSEADDKKLAKLLAVVDKGRLQNYESQYEKGDLVHTASISTWNGNIVLGWKTIKNEVGFENGIMRENQTIRVFLLNQEDPKKEKHEDLQLLDFSRHVEKREGEIIKDSTEAKTGRRTVTIKLKDGMELDYDIAFIN